MASRFALIVSDGFVGQKPFSFISQTVPEQAIIVIDGGFKDDGQKIINAYCPSNP